MDLNFNELGTTMVIGAYLLVGLALIFLVFIGSNLFRVTEICSKLGLWGTIVVLAFISYPIGLLAEDLSNKFVDTGTEIPKYVLPPENELRATVLFGDKPTERVASLGRGAARHGLLSRYGGKEGADAEYEINNKKRLLKRKNMDKILRDLADDLYYQAKNIVYDKTNYYDELTKIQTRVDFARSFAIISLFLLFVSILLLVLRLFLRPICNATNRVRRLIHLAPIQVESLPKIDWAMFCRWFGRWLAIGAILGIFFVLGRFSYAAEEREFNVRVYGYFSTMRGEEQLKMPKTVRPRIRALPDISGMARMRDGRFVVVHDVKMPSLDPRLGILGATDEGLVSYETVAFDWSTVGLPPNDLEAVCAIHGEYDDFLISESGYWTESGYQKEKKYGRIIHIRVTGEPGQWRARILNTIQLPTTVDNIEGIACLKWGRDHVFLVVGERGGTERNPEGKLQWGLLELDADQFVPTGERIISVKDEQWPIPDFDRDIADLYLDDDNVIWGVATDDPGSGGPFRSVVYRIGEVKQSSGTPVVQANASPRVRTRIAGFKIEALAGPAFPGTTFSVASDDENFGGIWRPLR